MCTCRFYKYGIHSHIFPPPPPICDDSKLIYKDISVKTYKPVLHILREPVDP